MNKNIFFSSEIKPVEAKEKLKVLIISHDDLDGSGGASIGRLIEGKTNGLVLVTAHFVSNKDCNMFIERMISNNDKNLDLDKYDYIYIIDLCLSETTMKTINTYISNRKNPLKNKIVYIDHHQQSLKYNEYTWVLAEIDTVLKFPCERNYDINMKILTCGTYTFLDVFLFQDDFCIYLSKNEIQNCVKFANIIRGYDTFDFKNNPETLEDPELSELYNSLFLVYGSEASCIVNSLRISNGNLNIETNSIEYFLIQNIRRNADLELMEILSHSYSILGCVMFDDNSFKLSDGTLLRDQFGDDGTVLFATCYNKSTKNALIDYVFDRPEYKDTKLIVIKEPYTISIRSRNKTNIDCSVIAEIYGGAGHKHAAGFPIDEHILETIAINEISEIFSL